MTQSLDRIVATALAATLVLAGAGSAVAVPGAIPDDPTSDGGNETDAGGTIEGTVDDAENATDDTTDSTDSASNTTDDTVDNTTDATGDTVDNTTDATGDTVDNTTDATGDTVEETEETVDETADTVSDTVEETGNTTDEATAEIQNATGSLEGTPDAIEGATDETSLTAGTDWTGDADTDADAESDAPTDDAGDGDGTDGGMDGGTATPSEREDGTDADEVVAANAGAEDDGGAGSLGPAGSGPIPLSPGSVGPGSAAGAVAVGGAALALGRRYGLSTPVTSALRVDPATARGVGRYGLERLREYGWRLLALLGYERYAGDPLEHDLRAAIHEEIRADPGIHLSAVAGAVDAPLGTVRYHLKRLEAGGLVESETSGGRRRYVPAGTEPDALATALREDATRAVLDALFEEGPASTTELADRIDRDPSTVSHHVSRLEEDGLVARERDGRAVESRLSDETRAALARRRAGELPGAGESAGRPPAATTD